MTRFTFGLHEGTLGWPNGSILTADGEAVRLRLKTR
jgi:hypothetical protein